MEAVSSTVKKVQDLEVSNEVLKGAYKEMGDIPAVQWVVGVMCNLHDKWLCLATVLQSEVLEAETRNKQMVEQKNTYANLLEKERTNSLQNQTRVHFYFLTYCYFNVFFFFRLMIFNGFVNRLRN